VGAAGADIGPDGDFVVEFLDNASMEACWSDVERTLRRAFERSDYIDEGFDSERPIAYTRWGMEGRLGPGMKHFVVRDAAGAIIAGFLCIQTEREPGQTVCAKVGWIFVTPEVTPRNRLRIINTLMERAFDAWRAAGFSRVEDNFGTLAGSKSIGRRFGIVHAPTPEKSNRWVKDL
jgi:hypothetical protein